MKVAVLFVDDHVQELEGLLRAAEQAGANWDVRTANDAEAALQSLQVSAADVVVSDLRMPGMDGGKLLSLVRERFPSVVRVMLSADAGARGFMRAAAAAHQVLSKPCDFAVLKRVIDETLALQRRLQAPELVEAMHQVGALPSLPQISRKLEDRLQDDYATLHEIASIVASDSAIVTRVLQLANSAYFRRNAEVTDVQSAISRLGFELIRSLVLTRELYAQLPPLPGIQSEVQAMNARATRVAEIATFLAGKHADPRELLTVAVLCGVGRLLRLLLSVPIPDTLPDTLLGAYLLSLWGLPFSLVQAVAFADQPAKLLLHHTPGQVLPVAVLIHLARCFEARVQQPEDALPRWEAEPRLESALLPRIDVLQLQAWEESLRLRLQDPANAT